MGPLIIYFLIQRNFRMNRLNVKDMAGSNVMKNIVGSSLIDLLTKRYNLKVDYTLEPIDIFRDLTKFSGLGKSRKPGKQKLFNGGTVTLIPDTPKKYFDVVKSFTWHTTCW